MLWTLLIWVVIGLVMMAVVWPIAMLVRAYRNGFDLELYLVAMSEVLNEDDAEKAAKHSKFRRIVSMVFHNVFWPNKLIWLTKDFMPSFDERYADLVLERLEKGEHA